MSLVTCPECGKENISDSARACPSCGYNLHDHFEKIKFQKIAEENKKRAADNRKKQLDFIETNRTAITIGACAVIALIIFIVCIFSYSKANKKYEETVWNYENGYYKDAMILASKINDNAFIRGNKKDKLDEIKDSYCAIEGYLDFEDYYNQVGDELSYSDNCLYKLFSDYYYIRSDIERGNTVLNVPKQFYPKYEEALKNYYYMSDSDIDNMYDDFDAAKDNDERKNICWQHINNLICKGILTFD